LVFILHATCHVSLTHNLQYGLIYPL